MYTFRSSHQQDTHGACRSGYMFPSPTLLTVSREIQKNNLKWIDVAFTVYILHVQSCACIYM